MWVCGREKIGRRERERKRNGKETNRQRREGIISGHI